MISGVPADTVARQRRPAILLSILALVWTLLGVVRSTLHAGDGLVGEYFTNLTWSGSPAFSNVDAQPTAGTMMQRWNDAPPGQFSVRWTGFLSVGRTGLYTFATTSDDGSQLIVDNQLVVDNGGPHGVITRSGRIQLTRGSHVVVLRYVQFGGASVLDWSWSRDGGADAPVPAWALSQRPARYATVVNARIVGWGVWTFGILTVLAALRYVRAGLKGREEAVVPLFVSVMILFTPWAIGGPFFKAVELTVRDLNRAALAALADFAAFQANLNTPQTGEYVVGSRVEEMLTLLRGHGVERYWISDSIAENAWVSQQIVAAGWPRKLEKDAKTGFVLNTEPVGPSCHLIEKGQDVSLVYCP